MHLKTLQNVIEKRTKIYKDYISQLKHAYHDTLLCTIFQRFIQLFLVSTFACSDFSMIEIENNFCAIIHWHEVQVKLKNTLMNNYIAME